MKFLWEVRRGDAIINKVEEDRGADTDKVGVRKCRPLNDLQKGLNFTRKHILPHLAEIGSNVLMDVMEGKNMGQSIKLNARQHARSAMMNERR